MNESSIMSEMLSVHFDEQFYDGDRSTCTDNFLANLEMNYS